MLHLGAGAFFRAHTAVFTEDAHAGDPAGERWGIAAVAHSSPAVVRALRARDGRYGLLELGGGTARGRIVGAVREAHVAAEEPAAVRARLADPEVTVVTVTITEAGYHHDPVTRRLRAHDPDLQADMAGDPHRTAVGLLVAGLGDRAAAGAPGLSVLVCDNVDDGGPLLAGLVAEFCARTGRGALADWVAEHVRFPTTVVDRIVPAPDERARARVREHLGWADEASVVTETHRQWVITDDLAAPRPAWERAGALLVPDAAPWARAKLRLVNAPHTALALLGGLRGHTTVAGAMADDGLAAAVTALLDEELVPTVPAVPRLDPVATAQTSLRRFADPALAHPLAQIATDTSLKIGPRLLAPALELAPGGPRAGGDRGGAGRLGAPARARRRRGPARRARDAPAPGRGGRRPGRRRPGSRRPRPARGSATTASSSALVTEAHDRLVSTLREGHVMDLTGTVAVVTGGGTGIGAAIAESLRAGRGGRGGRGVHALGRRRPRDRGPAARAGRRRLGGPRARRRRRRGRPRRGRARAGVPRPGRRPGQQRRDHGAGPTSPTWTGATDDIWHDVLDVNLVGAFRCARALAPAAARGRRRGGQHRLGLGLPGGRLLDRRTASARRRCSSSTRGAGARARPRGPGQRGVAGHGARRGGRPACTARRASPSSPPPSASQAPLGRTAGPEHVAQAVSGLLAMDLVTGEDIVVDAGRWLTS